ncbi:MAG TPA: hypothetical protein VKF61_07965 [Candidatus Polarisedimenticolia bacterium]|nr:hypothetical protein [Candidatus Polarisedimenticolia bacterium]
MTTRRAIRAMVGPASLALALVLCMGCAGKNQEETTATVSGGGEGTPASSEGGNTALAPVPSHQTEMPGQGSMSDMAPHGQAAGGAAGHLTWTAPQGFIEERPKSSMRMAQYRLPASPGDTEDGECVVYYFGAGQGGDVKSNLDRWASQFTGPGSTTPKLSTSKAGGLSIDRAEVRGTYTPSPMAMGGGPEPQPKSHYMLLGAIVPGPDANWFFKCTGPEKTMEANRAGFDSLLASIQPAH